MQTFIFMNVQKDQNVKAKEDLTLILNYLKLLKNVMKLNYIKFNIY